MPLLKLTNKLPDRICFTFTIRCKLYNDIQNPDLIQLTSLCRTSLISSLYRIHWFPESEQISTKAQDRVARLNSLEIGVARHSLRLIIWRELKNKLYDTSSSKPAMGWHLPQWILRYVHVYYFLHWDLSYFKYSKLVSFVFFHGKVSERVFYTLHLYMIFIKNDSQFHMFDHVQLCMHARKLQ